MVVEPIDTPVTKPVVVIVATAVFDEVHGLLAFAVAEPVNCVVPPTQTSDPLTVGNGFTVTVFVSKQPLELV